MVLQNPISSLGPIGNFMYEGDTLGRGYYQGLANTKTYKDILGMADDAAFDKTLGNIKNPTLNRLGYTARGLQSVGQSLLGFTPRVGSVNIGGGTIPGRVFYEKVLKNPFAKALGYGTRAFTGLPGLAATGLYGISQQMKPGSALSNFIKQGPANYEKLQNELRLKQMRKTTGGSTPGGIGLRSGRFNYNQAKKALADRVANYNAANTTTKMTATGDVYSVGRPMNKNRTRNKKVGRRATKGERDRAKKGRTGGGFCFDPNTLVKMYDGTEKKIKDIKLGDQTKGGEVTGVFQFKASDEIHDYKGVTVAGSHYVKEDGKFIMVQDSPISVKIDKIPVVHSLDTTGRRIFIKDIEFADYNGDGIAKGFLANAGVDLTGFDKEVLRQVENRLI